LAVVFHDIEAIAASCRFSDCRHGGEPGCAVAEAVRSGEVEERRFDRWRALREEVEAAALRAVPHERRRSEKSFSRLVRGAQQVKRKGPGE
jgi:ribosome biogenesis GTPase